MVISIKSISLISLTYSFYRVPKEVIICIYVTFANDFEIIIFFKFYQIFFQIFSQLCLQRFIRMAAASMNGLRKLAS